MKQQRFTAYLLVAFMVVTGLFLVAPFVAALGMTIAEASGGPVAKQDPTCDDAAKVGSVLMNPGGTKNAMEQIVFDVPFCTDELAAFATVNNHNTAGEAVGAMAWSEAVNISMQLRYKSSDLYTVFWRVEPITE